jgi:arginyl-tRNA synthetase
MERAMAAIQAKNPDLQNKEETAKQVGVGAVIFHDLFNQRIKNVEFNWEDVLSFEGTTGPYVQYTYARAKSILRKGGLVENAINYKHLTDDSAYALVKTLSGYDAAVLGAAERYEPSVVARYIISVASAFNKFYHECPILTASEEEKQARLVLVNAVQKVLKNACGLLGMECPEEM